MYKFKLLSAIFATFAMQLSATEIFIADVKFGKNQYFLSNVHNITKRQGYDNQPHFSKHNKGLFYTAMLGKSPTTQQTDIMYYDFATKRTHNVTNTKNVSEYSPTEIENDSALSMIIVEPDGNQRLWKTLLNEQLQNKGQSLINKTIQPVGYHSWDSNQGLLLFVLGEPMTLQYIKSPTKVYGQLVDDEIGRSLHFNSHINLFTYSKSLQGKQQLKTFNAKTGQLKELTFLPDTSQDYTWLDDSTIISAAGSVVYKWHYTESSSDNKWSVFADLTNYCSTNITRMAVNPSKTNLAFVCDEQIKEG
ncbi:MAG: hypothetical protein HWE10_03700 [Gammaproteobacteria bacterium]|nr:hypothetical protein [Gammaproteobacteria bacterium]